MADEWVDRVNAAGAGKAPAPAAGGAGEWARLTLAVFLLLHSADVGARRAVRWWWRS